MVGGGAAAIVIRNIMCVTRKQNGFEASGQMLEEKKASIQRWQPGWAAARLPAQSPALLGMSSPADHSGGPASPAAQQTPPGARATTGSSISNPAIKPVIKRGSTTADCPLACPPTPVPTPVPLGKHTNRHRPATGPVTQLCRAMSHATLGWVLSPASPAAQGVA